MLLGIAVILVFAIVVTVLEAMCHAIATHLLTAGLCLFVGVPVLAIVLLALGRGMAHHVIISRAPPLPAAEKPELPAPAAGTPVTVAAEKAPGPFSASPDAWDELIERAEREELHKPGPREARKPDRCAWPPCGSELDEYAWEIEVDNGEDTETHRCCSRECLDNWKRQDAAARTAPHGGSHEKRSR